MVLALACTCASAQPAQPKPNRAGTNSAARDAALDGLLKGFDSDDVATRERAAAGLASTPAIDLAALTRRIGDRAHPLSPEQALRLNEAGVKLLKSSPRGAMGVSFGRSTPDTVEIGLPVEGFESMRVLRQGDVVRTIAGVKAAGQEQARAIILSHDPGAEVTLEITRAGEPSTVTLHLGSYSDLDQGTRQPMADPVMREAWRLRCARAAGDAAGDAEPVIESGVSAAQYRAAMQRERRQQQQALVDAQTNPRRRVDDGSAPVLGGGGLRRLEDEPDRAFTAAPKPKGDGVLAALRAESISTGNQIRQFEKQLRNPRLNAAERQQFQGLVRGQRNRLATLRKQIAMQEKAGDSATADVNDNGMPEDPAEKK